MAQNITWLGNSYSDVPYVQLPATGGGTARFDDASVTTASASDVASGKIFLAADGTPTQGTASGGGGGGASNVVTGTFKGTTTGAAMDVTLNYSGSGYPIAVLVFPSDGTTSGTFGSTIQRYAFQIYTQVKADTSATPSYINATEDATTAMARYKNSTTSSTNYSMSGGTGGFRDADAGAGTNNGIRVRSATKMSVYIASTSYGFMANVEYRYVVLYSS